jgi:hypothetical protein
MRGLLIAAILAAIPSVAAAQTAYLEGSLGVAIISDIETDDYTMNLSGSGLFEGRNELSFESEVTGGVEAGLGFGPWRFGVAWDFMTAQLDTARVVGTVDGVPFLFEGTDSDIADLTGLSFQEDVATVSANAYYNFGAEDASWRPFVGIGIGGAAFQDSDVELAVNATAGARFALSPRAYLGARYRLTWIEGPQDDLGIKYNSIYMHTVSVVFGFYFAGR